MLNEDTIRTVRKYVVGYIARHGKTPSYGQVCKALGIGSKSTVARYMRPILQEECGKNPALRRTPPITKPVPLQRYRLDLADRGVIWLACAAFPSVSESGNLVFSGVFDTTLLRGSVSYIVGSRVEEA